MQELINLKNITYVTLSSIFDLWNFLYITSAIRKFIFISSIFFPPACIITEQRIVISCVIIRGFFVFNDSQPLTCLMRSGRRFFVLT